MQSRFSMDQISLLSNVPCIWPIMYADMQGLSVSQRKMMTGISYMRSHSIPNTQCRRYVWYKRIIATTQSCLGMNNLLNSVSTGLWLHIPKSMNAMSQRNNYFIKKGTRPMIQALWKQLLVIPQAHHRPLLFTWVIFLCMDRSLHRL